MGLFRLTIMDNFEEQLAKLSPAKQALLRKRLAERAMPSTRRATIPRCRAVEAIPLSHAQERVWLHQQLSPGSVAYNRPSNVRIRGPLNPPALRAALEWVVARHDSLRSIPYEEAGVAAVRILPLQPPSLQVEELSGAEMADEELSESLANELAAREAARPFNLEEGPLFRFRLLRLSPDDHLLLATFHHFTFDAWSQHVFVEELTRAYDAFASGSTPTLPSLPVQYADLATWERDPEREAELGRKRARWRTRLVDAPVLRLPTDFPRPNTPAETAAHCPLTVPDLLRTRLQQFATREQATPFSVLLTAFATLLLRYSGEQEFVIGCPVAGREYVEAEPLIGVFINPLPLRTRIDPAWSFQEALQRVHASTLEDLVHQQVPFQWIVQDSLHHREPGVAPLFQTFFIFERFASGPKRAAGANFADQEVPAPAILVDLSLELTEAQGVLGGWLNYRSDLWESASIERMRDRFLALLEAAIERPDQPVGELPMLTSRERQQMLVEWNDTDTIVPVDHCIHQEIERQAQATPDRVALVFDDERLTYAELDARATRLASYLRSLGVGPDHLVGICLERSMDLVVGVLATLKAGGAYVPLDPDYPRERLADMLEDSQVTAVLTHEHLRDALPTHGARVVCLDADRPLSEHAAPTASSPDVQPHHLAYVIYTSGSTGKPKGVMVEHRNAINFFVGMDQCLAEPDATNYGEQPGTWLAVTSLSFDISVLELLWTLSRGFRVVLCRNRYQSLAALVERYEVTHLQCTPSMARMLTQDSGSRNALRRIRYLLIGGEAFPLALARELDGLVSGTVMNMYGPTETTVWSSTQPVVGSPDMISIGRPIANTQMYVLDARREPVPAGEIGELYIGGAGVTRGYLRRPELTAERFVPNPFRTEPNARMYRTGDLARFLPDGSLEFLGRVDHQVKIRGYRIELGEIESLLGQHPAIRENVVVAREDQPGDQRLTAYYVPRDSDPGAETLKDHLRSRLPDYMVPAQWLRLASLPQTPNGKIDRKTLPAPGQENSPTPRPFVAPEGKLQQKLAELWKSVLGLEQIDVDDDFFNLGGHSLLAVKLFAMIETRFGRRLPLASLFQHRTVREMGALLDSAPVDSHPASVFTIHPGEGAPLILMPGLRGELPFSIARALRELPDTNFPVLGVQPSLAADHLAIWQDFRRAASVYADAILAHPFQGPPVLAGYSYGAYLAHEVARQLAERGHSVPLVVAIDSGPGYRGLRMTVGDKLLRSLRILGSIPAWLREEARGFSATRLGRRLARKLHRLRHLANSNGQWQPSVEDYFPNNKRNPERDTVARATLAGFQHYSPSPHAGPLALVRATAQALTRGYPQDLGWSRFAASVDIKTIRGDHENLLRAPRVQQIAAYIAQCMQQYVTNPKHRVAD